jgi:hypothetical protein
MMNHFHTKELASLVSPIAASQSARHVRRQFMEFALRPIVSVPSVS